MDAKDIKDIIETVGRMGISNLELSMEGIRLVIGGSGHSGNREGGNAAAAGNNPEKPAVDENKGEDMYIVKSPMVGTYYSSPSPDAVQFVKVGSAVKKGDTLCIIEAMKVMNEIVSEYQGEVAEIFITNGEVVEYGQPILSIRKGRDV